MENEDEKEEKSEQEGVVSPMVTRVIGWFGGLFASSDESEGAQLMHNYDDMNKDLGLEAKDDKKKIDDEFDIADELFQKGSALFLEGKYEEAEKLYLKAADRGHVDAQCDLGKVYTTFKKYEEAEKWFRKAAVMEHLPSQYNLGFLHDRIYKKYDEAEKWYIIAGNRNYPDAQNNLGLLYKNVHKKFDEAEKWYKKAADNGHLLAHFNLGNIYKTMKKYQDAEKWYLVAAEKDHPLSCYHLGRLYENQLKNREKAKKYFQKAADKGHEKARKKIEKWKKK